MLDDRLNNSWIWDVEEFPESAQAQLFPRRASSLHVVAYTSDTDREEEAAEGRPPVNHWAFLIQVQVDDADVYLRFSMSSGESSKYPATLCLTQLAGPGKYQAGDAERAYEASCLFNVVTVREIITFIMDVRRRRLQTSF